jgi:hypothetical protein
LNADNYAFYTLLRGDESQKLNWMYKDKADNEEYLLGRRIDKAMVVEPEIPITCEL